MPADGTAPVQVVMTKGMSASQSQPLGRGESAATSGSVPSVRAALAAYRAVRFSIRTGVRIYFAEKEAAREGVRAAIRAARALGHRRAA